MIIGRTDDVVTILSALGVSGDAFLLEMSRKVILVDGGRSARLLAEALVKHRPALRRIDIVVCSHADMDHAGGLIDFPSEWSLACGHKVTVGEFWLPGRWRTVARESILDPKRLVDAMIHDIDNLGAGRPLTKFGDAGDIEREILGDESAYALDSAVVAGAAQTLGTVQERGGLPRLQGKCDSAYTEKPPKPSVVRKLKLAQSPNAAEHVRRQCMMTSADKAGDLGELPVTASAPVLRNGRLVVRPDHRGSDWSPEPETSREPGWLSDLEAKADRILQEDKEWRHKFNLGHRRIDYRDQAAGKLLGGRPSPSIVMGEHAAKFWHALIDTAERIGKVAATAIAARARVRWFDQSEFEETGVRRGGVAGVLLPMNACEQRSPTEPPMPEGVILYMLTISQANRRSLVFYAPPVCDGEFGVVFSADTALTWGYGDQWELPAYPHMKNSDAVGTAPHHGSDNNAIAYAHAREHYNVRGWLRGHNGSCIGTKFKAQEWRACTECPDYPSKPHRRRSVELSLKQPLFSMLQYDCCC